jgi:hypothetical protein
VKRKSSLNMKLQEITGGARHAGLRARQQSASMANVRDTNDTNDDLNSSGNRTEGDLQAE